MKRIAGICCVGAIAVTTAMAFAGGFGGERNGSKFRRPGFSLATRPLSALFSFLESAAVLCFDRVSCAPLENPT